MKPADHAHTCECRVCAPLKQRVVTDAEWSRRHAAHGAPTRAPFNHPSGKWYWLVCPCGAKQLTGDPS